MLEEKCLQNQFQVFHEAWGGVGWGGWDIVELLPSVAGPGGDVSIVTSTLCQLGLHLDLGLTLLYKLQEIQGEKKC